MSGNGRAARRRLLGCVSRGCAVVVCTLRSLGAVQRCCAVRHPAHPGRKEASRHVYPSCCKSGEVVVVRVFSNSWLRDQSCMWQQVHPALDQVRISASPSRIQCGGMACIRTVVCQPGAHCLQGQPASVVTTKVCSKFRGWMLPCWRYPEVLVLQAPSSLSAATSECGKRKSSLVGSQL